MKFIKTFFTRLLMGANIATILLLWASCGVTYLSPEWHPHITLLALAFPAFLIANVGFVLFWLIFKAKWVWVPLLGFACCFSFVRDYFPINWRSTTPDSTLVVLSYNTMGFGGNDARLADGQNIIVNHVLESGADIICLQESYKFKNYQPQFEAAGYECVDFREFALCSRLPIVSADTLALSKRSAHCLRAYLLDGADTIMLINQHLESNRLTKEVKSAYAEALEKHERDSMRKGIEPVMDLLATAWPLRALQTDSIKALIDEWQPRPVILCGDFNDTPISYSHRVLTSRLSSAFRESGNGLGFTFHTKGFPVRIDHILFSGDRWTSYETTVCDTITYSDHFPITTKLAKKEPQISKNR